MPAVFMVKEMGKKKNLEKLSEKKRKTLEHLTIMETNPKYFPTVVDGGGGGGAATAKQISRKSDAVD